MRYLSVAFTRLREHNSDILEVCDKNRKRHYPQRPLREKYRPRVAAKTTLDPTVRCPWKEVYTMTIEDPGINKFPSQKETCISKLLSRLKLLPKNEELNCRSEEIQNPAVVVYQWDLLKSTAVTCTRNLSSFKAKLTQLKARILYTFPTFNRDSQARKVWRFLRSRAQIEAEAGYTFYCKIESVESLLTGLKQSWSCEDSLKSVRQSLKALVRREISEVSKLKSVVRVSDVVERTLKYVDGLEIEGYLEWLAREKEIRYMKGYNIFDGIIKMV